MKDDVIFGVHPSKQMLDNNPDKILEVWVQSGKAAERLADEIALVNKQGIPIQTVDKQ